jgi:PKD repeat protein
MIKPDYIVVNVPSPPVAEFTAAPTTGAAPLTVSFSDQSTGSPTFWNWDFGAGIASSGQHPTHTYSNPGSYTVSLTLGNTTGRDVATKIDYISVNALPAPVADFVDWSVKLTVSLTVSDTTGTVSLTVSNTTGTDSKAKIDYVLVFTPPPPSAVTFEETQSGVSSDADNVTTSASVTGVNRNLYLAAISTKKNVTVSDVSGLGLNWTLVRAQCSGRDQTGVEVWMAQGSPTGDDFVTATLDSTPANAVIAVSRYSGVDGNNPIGNTISGNTNGANGACSGGSDNGAYSLDLTTTVDGAVVYGAIALRNRSHTPGPDYVERVEVQQGSGGDTAAVAVEDRTVASASTVTIGGSFSRSVDWSVVGLEIKPDNPN